SSVYRFCFMKGPPYLLHINRRILSLKVVQFPGGRSAVIANCTFASNYAKRGAGIYNTRASSELTNCIFSGNEAIDYGGGIYTDNCELTLTNCTLFGNSVKSLYEGGGGGMYNHWTSAGIFNSILWGNTSGSGENQIQNYFSTTRIFYSDIEGSGGSGGSWDTNLGTDEGGNIDANPLFYDPANGDFRLTLGSPCIDTGTNGEAPATDFEGESRPFDGDYDGSAITDMGADEWCTGGPVAPIPESGTILLMGLGVLGLGGIVLWRIRRGSRGLAGGATTPKAFM
ncbi:MAG: hypothetical protein FJZ95_07195, partial [Chloroflexi bacterium]|nr:hypothetical protein [Chloroflexota bacterium]